MAIINQSDYPHTIVVSASDERRGWVPKEPTDHCATELTTWTETRLVKAYKPLVMCNEYQAPVHNVGIFTVTELQR